MLPVTGKRHRVSLVGISWVRGTEGSERAQVRPKFSVPWIETDAWQVDNRVGFG